jgi:hypothetical protein
MIDELLERLRTFGDISHPRLSDLEEAVGPVFADVDDLAESTTEIHRPEAFAKGAFLFASIHGRHIRITKHDPISTIPSPWGRRRSSSTRTSMRC